MKIFREVSLADSLSVLNALFGFSAVVYAIQDFEKSFTFFYIALITDSLDGWVASKTEKSKIGRELDSLADAISFGLFPAIALFIRDASLFASSSLLLAFSILRLARFNVLNCPEFIGIPTSVSAIAITSLLRLKMPIEVLASASLILSILMVSDIRYPRIGGKYLAIAGTILLLAIFYSELCYLLLFAALLYAVYPAVRVWRRG